MNPPESSLPPDFTARIIELRAKDRNWELLAWPAALAFIGFPFLGFSIYSRVMSRAWGFFESENYYRFKGVSLEDIITSVKIAKLVLPFCLLISVLALGLWIVASVKILKIRAERRRLEELMVPDANSMSAQTFR